MRLPPAAAMTTTSQPAKARSITATTNTVPYFVLQLSQDGRAKALFTVPRNMAEHLVQRPILCHGACFDLEIDVVSQGQKGHENTCFLAAHFTSPHPEDTARAISERLFIRMGSSSSPENMPSVAGILGMK